MALTKVGSVGIATGISLTGITTTQDAKVGTGITLSPDGHGYYTGIVTATSYRGDVSNCTGVGQTNFIDAESLNVSGISTLNSTKVGTGITLSPDGDVYATGISTIVSNEANYVLKLKNDHASGSGLRIIAGETNGVYALLVEDKGSNNLFEVTGDGEVHIEKQSLMPKHGLNVTSGVSTFQGDISMFDTIYHTGDTNTKIRFPTNDTISFETSGSERLRIDSNGVTRNVAASRGDFYNGSYDARGLQVEGVSGDRRGWISLVNNSNNSGESVLMFGKTRGTSAGAVTIVNDSDDLGVVHFSGADGVDLRRAAEVRAQVDGTPAVNKVGGRLMFLTTADTTDANPTERMRITAAGNIGINQSTPTLARLHVVGPSTGADEIIAKFKGGSGSDCLSKIGLVAGYSDTANSLEGHCFIGALRNSSGNTANLMFQTYNGTAVYDRLQITSGGRFRIKSPTSTTGEQDGRLEWWNENGAGIMAKIAVDRTASLNAPADLVFSTSANVDTAANSSEGDITERFRIKSNGVSTFTGQISGAVAERNAIHYQCTAGSGANTQGFLLENTQANHSYGTVLRLHINTAGQDRAVMTFTSANSSSGDKDWMLGPANGFDDFRINSAGGGTSGSWGTTRFRLEHGGTFHGSGSNSISDQRLKDNITTISNASTKIKALRGVTFNWQSRTGMSTTTKYGFVAQEMVSVIPDLVCKTNGLFWFNKAGEVVPENNESRAENPDGSSWDIHDSGVIPVLVESLKEALAEIETLKTENTDLKTLIKNSSTFAALKASL